MSVKRKIVGLVLRSMVPPYSKLGTDLEENHKNVCHR